MTSKINSELDGSIICFEIYVRLFVFNQRITLNFKSHNIIFNKYFYNAILPVSIVVNVIC